jgi:hypothetical protein
VPFLWGEVDLAPALHELDHLGCRKGESSRIYNNPHESVLRFLIRSGTLTQIYEDWREDA